jgi:hypothetical protein
MSYLLFWRRTRDPRPSEATTARIQAERDLEATKAETPRYRGIAQRHMEIQRVNHLGLSAAKILRGEN